MCFILFQTQKMFSNPERQSVWRFTACRLHSLKLGVLDQSLRAEQLTLWWCLQSIFLLRVGTRGKKYFSEDFLRGNSSGFSVDRSFNTLCRPFAVCVASAKCCQRLLRTKESSTGVGIAYVDYVPPSVSELQKLLCFPDNLIVPFAGTAVFNIFFSKPNIEVLAQGVTFSDTNPLLGTVTGTISVTRAIGLVFLGCSGQKDHVSLSVPQEH